MVAGIHGVWTSVQVVGDLFESDLEFLLGAKIERVFRGEASGVLRQVEFDEGVVLAAAEHDADGGQFVRAFHLSVEAVHIHLHLAEILMGELVALEVDDGVRKTWQDNWLPLICLHDDDHIHSCGEAERTGCA